MLGAAHPAYLRRLPTRNITAPPPPEHCCRAKQRGHTGKPLFTSTLFHEELVA